MKTIGLLYDGKLDFGGVEQHLLGLLRCADASRYRFVFFSDTSDQFGERARALGARVVAYQRWRITDWGVAARLALTLQAEGIDLVHAHSPTAAAIGRLAARRLKIPALITVHMPVTQYHGQKRSMRASVGRWLYIAVDRWLNFTHPAPLVYVSQSVRDECVAKRISPAGKSLVIPNGIDLPAYEGGADRADLRGQFGLPAQAKLMVFIGRMSREKGGDVLIDAAAILARQGFKFNLWLVGEGQERSALENQVQQLGLASMTRFFGFQERVIDFLKAADVVVAPSRIESFGITVLEAMACGTPVVVTKVGGLPFLVQDGLTGLLVPENQPVALAKALGRIFDEPDLRRAMGEHAQLRAKEFSLSGMVDRVQKIYDELIERAI